DMLEGLCFSADLGIPLDELAQVAGEREVWVSLLRLLPPQPDPRISGRQWLDGWNDGWSILNHNCRHNINVCSSAIATDCLKPPPFLGCLYHLVGCCISSACNTLTGHF
ncbi:hypothetical protein ILYODFUR_013486, partial [Ilyodon furcidens]